MSTPVGHALIGTGVASIVAKTCGIRNTSGLLIGAAIASSLPDFDWILVLLGFPTKSVHRAATHSLLTLIVFVMFILLAVKRFSIPIDRRVIAAWAAAAISHPLLDLFTTPPYAAASGFGLPLIWPISSRRWAVRQEIFETPGLHGYRSPGRTLKAVFREACIFGPVAVLPILGPRLHRCTVKRSDSLDRRNEWSLNDRN